MTAKPIAEMTFEEAMTALEQVVGVLERGDVALPSHLAVVALDLEQMPDRR